MNDHAARIKQAREAVAAAREAVGRARSRLAQSEALLRKAETMPKGPQGQKRPADQNQLARRIVELASEGGDDKQTETPSESRARKAGLVGGKARAEKLPPARREEIARKAAESRWKK